MKIVAGDLEGSVGKLVNDVFKGPVIILKNKTFKLKECQEIILIEKLQTNINITPTVVLISFFTLGAAILYYLFKKETMATIKIKTIDDLKFIITCNGDELSVLSNCFKKSKEDLEKYL